MASSNHRDSAARLKELVRVEQGEIGAEIFVDPEIFRLEEERIFARRWLFVAHESEISRPGDFVTRFMGRDPVIVWRGQDAKVRVFLNVCRHRGRRVCGEDVGRAAQFRCPYHGWTYSNLGELIAVPFFEGYEGKLSKEEFGLCEAEVGSYQGFIFARWERSGVGLGEDLGEMKWVMDLLFGRTAGVEVMGEPMRWEVDANWKLGAANFAGDGMHIPVTHGYLKALNLGTLRTPQIKSATMPMSNGHAGVLTYWEAENIGTGYLGLPENLWPEIQQRLGKDQLGMMQLLVGALGNIFPNLSFLTTSKHLPEEWGGPEGQMVSFLTIRQWQPKAADKMEVWSWCLVDREAPAWWREASRECYLRSFGMGGMFEQDDMENWGEITQALKGAKARRLQLQYKLGMAPKPRENWPGPAVAYSHLSPFELNERHFYSHWRKLMLTEEGGSADALRQEER